jgi:photosystem II protein PsbQ
MLAWVLAFVTAFLVSCGSPAETKAPTYTNAQIEQIQQYRTDISTLINRLPELATLIENRQWQDVQSFIHGPLGDLRIKLSKLGRSLLPASQSQARETAKEVFGHLEEIDEAAQNSDYRQAIRNYAETLKDLSTFFDLVPNS